MMGLAVLIVIVFALLAAGLVACVAACCRPPNKPASWPPTPPQPGWPPHGYAQNLNRPLLGQGVYAVPAPARVWPSMWVDPAPIVAAVAEPVTSAAAPAPKGLLQQRRQLSGLAQRVTGHGARR